MKTNIQVSEKHKSKMYFIYGSLSGVFGTTLLYPTYMIKRVFQANSKYLTNFFIILFLDDKTLTISKYVKQVWRGEGIKGYYRGLSVTLIKVIPYQGLLFWSNEKIKKFMNY